ncbi:MAG: hypothetical protein NTX43_02870 [Bacteroidetes bacterium]|nr:hypothetical protein [Bacteroidota bacterium]
MIVKPIIYDNILFGDLVPWKPENTIETKFRDILNNKVRVNKDNPEQFFKALMDSLKDYSISLKIDHLPNTESIANLAKFAEVQTEFGLMEIPSFFNKASEFYFYLIKNENIRIRAAISANVRKAKTAIDKEYQVVSLLKNLEYIIEQVAQKNVSDKLSTYVLKAIKISLFCLYEQIKTTFPDSIGTESLSDFEIINIIAPDYDAEKTVQGTISFHIHQYLQARQDTPIKIKDSNLDKPQPVGMAYSSFTYKHVSTQPEYLKDLFDSLKSNNLIDKSTIYTDFKKVFTGEHVLKPVFWTGNISELHYFIKLIHNIKKSVLDLKQHQWEVACKCFVKPDGSTFDRVQLKEQKKPKATAFLVEKVAKQLQ